MLKGVITGVPDEIEAGDCKARLVHRVVIKRGFIRAEIVAFEDLKSCGSMNAAKEKGLVRSEGKDYVMQDGDVTLFRFNV